MSMNLLDSVTSLLTPDLVDKAASFNTTFQGMHTCI